MDKDGTERIEGSKEVAERDVPRSVQLSEQGITTSRQFAGVMSALMADLLQGKITPAVGNAVCNAGGKMLKVVEMEQKFGKQSTVDGVPHKELKLA
jgi:hypothetical protein